MSSDETNLPDAESLFEDDTDHRSGLSLRVWAWLAALLLIVAATAFVCGRIYFSRALRANLPQVDGTLVAYGLNDPVSVERDAHGVPHIRAQSMDDLVFAQGFVTAQDRLWQMELARRHAAGELAAVLGKAALAEDIAQRTLQLRAAADHIAIALPDDQKRWLIAYARGVNASIDQQRKHLPIEFRLAGYTPPAWTPGDSVLVELEMYEELTNTFQTKLVREALTARLPPELVADLYPVGSWRDHIPGAPVPDVTSPRPEYKEAPPEESQSKLKAQTPAESAADLETLDRALALFGRRSCAECVAGSNGWAVAGSRTASGKPMLSNDMHLALRAPGTWYEADLEAAQAAPLAPFHAAGVTLPGVPFVVAGHNDHVAWGFTNLGADIQDVYIEHLRNTPKGAQYEDASGAWQPLKYAIETIHVRGGKDAILRIPLTHHGDADTPVIAGLQQEKRVLSLRWTIYDIASLPVAPYAVNAAADWPSMLAAFANWGGPPLNLMYADDQGHIGYHAVGRIPIRGDTTNPAPLAGVPTDVAAPDAATHEWAGYIPFDQLPQSFDPPDGVLVTANSRVTADGYRYPIALDWMAPYRTERIYRVLGGSASAGGAGHPLMPADMLALQTDVHSDLDHLIAQRLAYAIDHASDSLRKDSSLRQAADLLRGWNGNVDADAAAPAIVNAARSAFWPLLLIPKVVPEIAAQVGQGGDLLKLNLTVDQAQRANLATRYQWNERGCVEEMLLTNTPARWLPAGYANWNDFLAMVVQRGLKDARAPGDLAKWQLGNALPVDIENPVFANSMVARALVGVRAGTGPQPHSGDGTTVKQMGAAFGPSERFTADLGDPDRTTLNIVLGEAGNPASPWSMDQFPDWLAGRTYALPFTQAATQPTITHTLTLTPR